MVKSPSRHEVRRRVAAHRSRRSGTTLWAAMVIVIVVVGVGGIALLKAGRSSADIGPKLNVIVNGEVKSPGDHWHAVLGVDICGEWVPAAQEFEAREGLHTHGDGRLHMHPYDSSVAGKRSTLGRYFELGSENSLENSGNWKLTPTEVTLWDGQTKKNGDTCPGKDGKPEKAEWRWAVARISAEGKVPKKLKVHSGDPADYHMLDGDLITLAFLPEDEEVPVPPQSETVRDPSEGGGSSSLPIDPNALTTAPTAPSAPTPDSGSAPTPDSSAPTPSAP